MQRVPSYIFVSECVHVPALARLFGNFAAEAQFLPGSGLVEATGHRLLTSDLDAIARLCRDLDVGQAYQAHLSESMPASLLDRLAEHERHRLLLAIEQARLEGVIDAVDAQSLSQVVSGQAPVHTASRWVESGALQVLGHEVTGALVFDLRGAWTPPPGLVDPLLTQGLILYLPHDGTGPIRRFDGWAALAQWLGQALGDRQWRDRFVQAIGLQTRSAFSLALAKRLKDPQVDPSPRSLALSTDPFVALALQLHRRLHDDALTLLVPTREFDRRQTLLRHAALTEAASGLLGLVGGFIPGVNELLLAQMAGQLLSGVFEGVVSWAQGHRHEAVDHLLGVAENLAANAVLAAGGQWVARAIQRAAHVDALQPILTEAGPRLWSGELTAFRDSVPETASLHANGLRHQAGHWWWEHTQQSFRVQQRTSGSWHLADPARPDSYGPELIHNGEHGWRLRYERPLEWSAAHEMLWRLWPAARALDAQRLQHVLQVAGLDAAHVRALWVEQQGVPFDLRETLQRFAVDQQVTALYQRLERVGADGLQPFATVLQHLGLATGWGRGRRCAGATDGRRLRLQHFSRRLPLPPTALAVLPAGSWGAGMSPGRVPRALVVVNVLLGTVTVSLNNSSLNPALPAFIEAFAIGPVMATWIVAAFMVSMGMAMPLTSHLAQRWGRKPLYLFGLAAFTGGSLLGAMAGSIEAVIVARAVQGAASGLMIPLSLAIIFAVYPKGERGRVTGLWGAAVMLAPALGPLCGSLVLEVFDWHALFLINVPIGVLAMALGWRVLPQSDAGQPKPFDTTGYALVALGIGALMLTLGQLHGLDALSEPLNLAGLALALLCLAGFVRHELRHPAPLLELRVFSLEGYRTSVVIAVVQSIGMFQCLVLIPLQVQMVMGQSALWTGSALLLTAVAASAFGQWGGRLLDRHGPRGVVSAGLLLTGLATFALGTLGPSAGLPLLCLLMVIRGAGLGLSYMPVTTAGLDVLPEHLVTQGAAMNNISRRVLSSLAIVLGSLWLQARAGSGFDAGQAALASAVGEVFNATGMLILLTLPLVWRFPLTPSPDTAAPDAAAAEHRT